MEAEAIKASAVKKWTKPETILRKADALDWWRTIGSKKCSFCNEFESCKDNHICPIKNEDYTCSYNYKQVSKLFIAVPAVIIWHYSLPKNFIVKEFRRRCLLMKQEIEAITIEDIKKAQTEYAILTRPNIFGKVHTYTDATTS